MPKTLHSANHLALGKEPVSGSVNIVRRVMYKGYYMLDNFIQHVPEEEDIKEQAVSCSLSLSKLRPACFSTGSKYGTENLEEMLESLENTIAGMNELLIFLRNYPPMFRQPYSTYLFMEKCMSGRQMEMERIINFLLYEDAPCSLPFRHPTNCWSSKSW